MQKTIVTFIIYTLTIVNITAQTKIVTGKVTDEQNEPLPGATIQLKNSTVGTISNFEGNFAITVTGNSPILLVSFLGYETKEVNVSNQNKIQISLFSKSVGLNEIVAIGYGTARRREISGSVSSANVDDIVKTADADPLQSLAGRVAGVQVSTTEGEPGADILINIRGNTSVTNSNTPLYVVDGFPDDDGDALRSINPSDIESIDFLKDASTTSIYGSRGANGVVLITTKQATKTGMKVTYNGSYGISQISNEIDVLGPADFVQLQYDQIVTGNSTNITSDLNNFYDTYINLTDEEFNNLGITKPTTQLNSILDTIYYLYGDLESINWQQEALGRDAFLQNHNISLEGGEKNTKYILSLTHNDREGVLIGSGHNRNIIRLNIKHQIGKMQLTLNSSYTESKTYGVSTSKITGQFDNILLNILRMPPTFGKYSNQTLDGDKIIFQDDDNNYINSPIASIKSTHREKTDKITFINGSLKYELTKNLEFKTLWGIKYTHKQNEEFYGENNLSVINNSTRGPYGIVRNITIRNWNTTNLLLYNKKIKNHTVAFTLGQEYVQKDNQWTELEALNFPNGDIGLGDLSLGITPSFPSSNAEQYRLLSFFGRANYNYKQKYILTFSYRADGSSRFGESNKFGYFPATSAAWRINNEPFFNLDAISNLKIRVSYGITGNDNIGNYRALQLYETNYYSQNNQEELAIIPSNLANPDLKWETTASQNIGIDIGLLKQRIQIMADAYISNTYNLLLNRQIPYTSGFATYYENIGEVQNKGLELSLNTINIRTRNFKWTSDFNISFNVNKIKELARGQDKFFATSGLDFIPTNDYIIQVGQPIGLMYGYVQDGLYGIEDFSGQNEDGTWIQKNGIAYAVTQQAPGDIKFKDLNQDGLIGADDKQIIGNANPKHFGGLTNTLTYKNLDLSIFINWVYGNDIYNATKLILMTGGTNRNRAEMMKDRWTGLDDQGNPADMQGLLTNNEGVAIPRHNGIWNQLDLYDGLIEDGSFLRINNITLGYIFPNKITKKIKLSLLRLSLTVNNLYTFTNYTGYDPEVSTRGVNVTRGVDYGAYPKTKSYIVAIKVQF